VEKDSPGEAEKLESLPARRARSWTTQLETAEEPTASPTSRNAGVVSTLFKNIGSLFHISNNVSASIKEALPGAHFICQFMRTSTEISSLVKLQWFTMLFDTEIDASEVVKEGFEAIRAGLEDPNADVRQTAMGLANQLMRKWKGNDTEALFIELCDELEKGLGDNVEAVRTKAANVFSNIEQVETLFSRSSSKAKLRMLDLFIQSPTINELSTVEMHLTVLAYHDQDLEVKSKVGLLLKKLKL
jgi:hypothetical protein